MSRFLRGLAALQDVAYGVGGRRSNAFDDLQIASNRLDNERRRQERNSLIYSNFQRINDMEETVYNLQRNSAFQRPTFPSSGASAFYSDGGGMNDR